MSHYAFNEMFYGKIFSVTFAKNKSTALSFRDIILLIIKVKQGHNSENKAFRIMPLVLQLQPVLMSKYFK